MNTANKYGLIEFEENDMADLVEYSKTMNEAIIEALDNNQGEQGPQGPTGPAGLGVPARRNNRTSIN